MPDAVNLQTLIWKVMSDMSCMLWFGCAKDRNTVQYKTDFFNHATKAWLLASAACKNVERRTEWVNAPHHWLEDSKTWSLYWFLPQLLSAPHQTEC